MSIASEYYMRENTRLSDLVFELGQEVKRLQQYESTVHYIANDYIELSYDKAQWQRDDWRKRCVKTISEAPLEWTENYGQGSEPWLKDDKK
jgi:hypothetical protein